MVITNCEVVREKMPLASVDLNLTFMQIGQGTSCGALRLKVPANHCISSNLNSLHMVVEISTN